MIERAGVRFVFDTQIGSDITIAELEDRFDAVFVSIGTWKESLLNEPGTELRGVYPALHYLESVARNEQLALGRRVVVIGGGNAAIDSARTAIRQGGDVTVVYRRELKDMPAIEEETAAAKEEGVKFLFLAAPHRIVGDEAGNVRALEIAKTRLGEFDASGRRKPVPTGEVQRLECESVILAIGEALDAEFARASGLRLREGGKIEVNRYTLETSRPRVYAGGDLIAGPNNVSSAMAYGKVAARAIDGQLMGSDRWETLTAGVAYGQTVPGEPNAEPRHSGHALDPVIRCHCDEEVVAGLTREEALTETSRCLRCDLTAANIS